MIGDPIELRPIARLRSDCREKVELPRQPGLASATEARVCFDRDRRYEVALADLDGFEFVWLITYLDRARDGEAGDREWKAKVLPPRGDAKRGLFATRSPHRPNPIGLSCVRLLAVRPFELWVGDHDLLDGTPILDVKPYVPYADARPQARAGWLDALPAESIYRIVWRPLADEERSWLLARGVDLATGVEAALRVRPFPRPSHRVREIDAGPPWCGEFAYKTWRLAFVRDDDERTVSIDGITSGYDAATIAGERESRWPHVPLHREFREHFGGR